jgi:hypothetical protein
MAKKSFASLRFISWLAKHKPWDESDYRVAIRDAMGISAAAIGWSKRIAKLGKSYLKRGPCCQPVDGQQPRQGTYRTTEKIAPPKRGLEAIGVTDLILESVPLSVAPVAATLMLLPTIMLIVAPAPVVAMNDDAGARRVGVSGMRVPANVIVANNCGPSASGHSDGAEADQCRAC